MSFRRALIVCLFLTPGLARAQNAPEQLLSAKTQLYLRWDGQKAHRDAYLQTALGKMMQGDTGKMIDNLFGLVRDNLTASLTVQGLLEGAPPEKVEKMQAEVAQASKLLGLLGDHGIIVAAEVQSVLPPAGQATVIVPDCGNGEPLFAALRLIVGTSGKEIKQTKVGQRTVSYLQDDDEMAYLSWWLEGKHAVVVVSTAKPEDVIKSMTGPGPKLPSAPLYKRLAEFKEYPTTARAFLDLEALTKLATVFGKEVTQVIDALGLDGLKAVTFLSGYEGEAERGLTEILSSGERKGLLGLLKGEPFKLADVPALPPDAVTWSMVTFDAAETYDVAVRAAEQLLATFAPDQADQLKEALKQADQALGINIRKDLLGALGNRMLTYSSPGEGIFTLSQTVAIKVKSPERILDTLDQLAKGLAGLGNIKLAIKKRNYRGVELHEVRINQEGNFFLPSYAVVGDWLVLGFYPQQVQGFILRAKGELPAWKPDNHVVRSLDKMPREFLAVSVSDPRPSVRQVFALAPLIGSAVRSVYPDSEFDPGLIPNGHEACKHLFPNVTVVSDDGKTTRIETRASLSLPLDLAGVDAYFLAIAGIGFFSALAEN